MTTQQDKVLKPKLGLLELAKQLVSPSGNMTQKGPFLRQV